MFYRQCVFKQDCTQTTAWIEERGARVGLKLTFKDTDSGVWEVVSVGTDRMPESRAIATERAYLKHRQFSDI